jgi:ADP-ribosylglycohydrolase
MKISVIIYPLVIILSINLLSLFTTTLSSSSSSLVSAMNTLKKERIIRSFITGLIGDALSLGGHYEYDAKKIKAQVGRYTNYLPPGESNNGIGWGTANYHPGKRAGDLTDTGDIAIMLLECIAMEGDGKKENYSFDNYAKYWYKQITIEGYGSCNFQSVGRDAKGCPPGLKPGYINGGSRRTLQALSMSPNAIGDQRKALAADVNCLIAATHFLPLFLISDDEEYLVKESIATVYLSHRNRDPVAAAEFLSRAMYNLIHRDMNLQQALEIAAQKTNYPLIQKWIHDAIAKVDEVNTPSSALSKEIFVDDIAITSMARLWDVGKTEPIKIGKASPTEGALPSALYFALKYQHDIEEALIANAGCGGDSAARAMVIGMLLGMFINASLSDVIQLNCVNLSVSIIIIIIIIITTSSSSSSSCCYCRCTEVVQWI